MTTFCVLWTYRSTRYLIDFDDEAMALRAAIHLGEQGRIDIVVTRTEYEPDPEIAARVWARINDRLAMEWAIGVTT